MNEYLYKYVGKMRYRLICVNETAAGTEMKVPACSFTILFLICSQFLSWNF